MVEDAVHFLSKETVVQAIARSATKVGSFLINSKMLYGLSFSESYVFPFPLSFSKQ